MKKIGIDCRFWGIAHAGLGRYTQELVTQILKQNTQFELVLFFRKKSHFKGKLPSGARIVEADIPHYSFKEQLPFARVVDAEHLDLVHYPHFNFPLLAKTPAVITIHDLIKHFFKGRPVTTRNIFVYWIKYGAYRFLIDQAVKKARHIISPSLFTKDQIQTNYSKTPPITVTYEGVSAPYNQPLKLSNQKTDALRRKYHLHKPFVIYTGSAYPSKNIGVLLKALKLYNQDSDNPIKLLIACARNHFWDKLALDVNSLGIKDQVVLPGKVSDEDLHALYSFALAFVMPSKMEGFGLPALEAMASGCPIISSNTGSLPEIYADIPTYFHPDSVQELKNAIAKVASWSLKERTQKILDGTNHAQVYTWEQAAHQTIKVYKEVLHN